MQGPWWHQWKPNGHCKSLVGINDNLLNNLTLCHWWKHSCNKSCSVKIILPLSSSFSPFYSSLPLWNQWQRIPISQSSCEFIVFCSIYHILFAPPVIMLCLLPLLWCSFNFISPFVIKGKGNTSWCFSHPLNDLHVNIHHVFNSFP